MMKSRYLFFCGVAAGLVFMTGKAAYSQDVNPTVEVSRAYRSGHAAVDKPAMQMAVPDSVLRFDIDVDYTVNASPYRGSYEFRPYMLDIRPDRTVSDAGQFFLRLGAGYSLHPVADVVYTPRFRTSAFSMGIYGTHRSYFGRYRSVGPKIGGMSSGMTLYRGRDMRKGGLEDRLFLLRCRISRPCREGYPHDAGLRCIPDSPQGGLEQSFRQVHLL